MSNAHLLGLAESLWSPVALQEPMGLRVYRNTIRLGEREAMRANFPSLCSLLGHDTFDAMAIEFLHQHPPSSASMLDWGAHLPEWLGQQLAAKASRFAELPTYLHGVALADTAWIQAHRAPNAVACTPERIAAIHAGGGLIQAHPAAVSLFWADAPVAAITMACRAAQLDLSDITWQGGGLLLTRPDDQVQLAACSLAAHQLLDVLKAPQTMPAALQWAGVNLGVEPSAAGQSLFDLFAHGALVELPLGQAA